ncbi:MAG: ATP synthase F1 subunit epsilon [Actinomycetota bacterium]
MALDVHVVTPEREVWQGEASLLIARGTEGEVGIMSGHAPMLIRLAVGPLRIQTAGGDQTAVVDGGFMHVTSTGEATRVDVLASQAELASDIDAEAARRRKEGAEARLRDNSDDEDSKNELAKAETRLGVLGS